MSYYESDYVRRHSMDHGKGVGNLFVERKDYFSEYGQGDLIKINPSHTQNDRKLFIQSAINISSWQNWLLKLMPSLERLSEEERRDVKEHFRAGASFNKILIKHHERLLNQ